MAHVAPDTDRGIDPDKIVLIIQKLYPKVSGDTIIAWVRTVVPVLINTVLVNLATLLPVVTTFLDQIYADWEILVVTGTVALSTAIYYAVARKIEKRHPNAGKWLLGSAKAPVYTQPDPTVAVRVPPAYLHTGGPVTVHVSAPPGVNLDDLAKQVSREIRFKD